ncbi:MAG: phosphoenolpyruvate--protein phosphotransferase [Kiloniellales bacterium]
MNAPAPSERYLQGEAASPGLLAGRIVTLRSASTAKRQAGTAEEEAAELKAAIDAAIAALTVLIEDSDGDAAEILGFQVAMLEDPALAEEAFAAIAEGAPADQAWQAALADQIEVFASSDDSYFKARSSDLVDLRDRVLRALSGAGAGEEVLPPGTVLLADDIAPSAFLAQDWQGRGIALRAGSASSHVAMLARARGVPLVLGLGPLQAAEGAPALLDAEAGALILEPTAERRVSFEARRRALAEESQELARIADKPAVTAQGEAVSVLLNVALPEELEELDPAICDGIGLVRSEFLFYGRDSLPDEEEQFAAYAKIVRWAAGRPVIFRTLDAGGDKPIAGLTEPDEGNPFLGRRGLRLCLAHPEVFSQQLRALLRAAELGPAKIMLPMVAVPEEVEQARGLLQSAAESVGVAALPPLGIMIEIPAAALTLERFAIDFASIGSNDLIQYTMAAARDGSGLGYLQRVDRPAVLHLIQESVAAADRMGIEISLCGDAGGDPTAIPALLATGLRRLSMAPPSVGRAKAQIAAWPEGEGHGG